MNLEKLTIGQMAALNNVSEQALRLYDKMDLLKPAYINEANNYRYYDISQSERLDSIRYYSRLGFSLSEIKEFNNSNLCDFMKLRLKNIEEDIKHLFDRKKAVMDFLSSHAYKRTLPADGTVFMEHLPESQVIIYKTDDNLYDYDFNHYIYNLRLFKKHLEKNNINDYFPDNVGTIIRRKDLSSMHLRSSEYFIPTTGHANDIIPGGTFLSMCCTDFEKEEAHANFLLHKVHALGLNVIGDYYCEVLSHESEAAFHYKIRVQVA